MRLIGLVAALAIATGAIGACGSEDESAPPEVERKPETAQKLPTLPRRYEPHLARVNGLALGRPPGWDARQRGVSTRLTAPDELVVMSLSADRTDEALAAEVRTLAVRTFAALQGYEGKLDSSEPRPFDHRYDAYVVKGEGVSAETGVRQRLRLIVLERPGVAVITALIAENAKLGARFEVDQALDSLGTLRTRPVG